MSHPALKLNFMLAATRLCILQRVLKGEMCLIRVILEEKLCRQLKKVEVETILFRILILMNSYIFWGVA
jgi:hypothetical protein